MNFVKSPQSSISITCNASTRTPGRECIKASPIVEGSLVFLPDMFATILLALSTAILARAIWFIITRFFLRSSLDKIPGPAPQSLFSGECLFSLWVVALI